jgi:1-acyl-sn-glycerol-3-phosphate acyltransferase
MIRTLFATIVVSLYLVLVGPFSILYVWLGGNAKVLYSFGRSGCSLLTWLAGIKVEVQGRQHVKPGTTYLFLANHQGNCDPPAIMPAIPRNVRFLLKKELRKIPFLGTIMNLGGFVFIDRKDRTSAMKGTEEAVAQMKAGHSFIAFPEGTRSRSGRMGPFKKGPFIMAIQAEVPIIPMTVSGSFEVMPPAQLKINPGTIRVVFHPQIATKGLSFSQRDELMTEVARVISSELKEHEQPLASMTGRNTP